VNKAFVKESDQDDDELDVPPGLPPGTRNYVTVVGHAALRSELKHLVERERPDLVQVVAWAASNGDRSENGDYIYGKKRLREIDRRIRFLMKRLETAIVVDPAEQQNTEQVFFGATVTVCDLTAGDAGGEETFQIVGVDEADPGQGRISWISPLARALLKAQEGDSVRFQSPAGQRELEVVAIRYVG
jgi:transcription elongation factor GreB